MPSDNNDIVFAYEDMPSNNKAEQGAWKRMLYLNLPNILKRYEIKKIGMILLLLMIGSPLFGATPVILEDPERRPGVKMYPLGLHLDILEDKEGTLTIEDVRADAFEEKWIPNEVEVPNFGFTESAYWVRFQIKGMTPGTPYRRNAWDPKVGPEPLAAENTQWLLELSNAFMDNVDFYFLDKEGVYQVVQSGTQRPFSNREIHYRYVVFPFSLQGTQPPDRKAEPRRPQTFFLRFQSLHGGSMQFPLTLWTPNAFTEKVNQEQTALGVYYGIMLSMIFYNLFIFFSLREKTYLYYVLYLFSFSLCMMIFNGLAVEYLWGDFIWWVNRSCAFFGGIFFVFISLFTMSFLRTQEYTPWLHKILWGFIGVSIVWSGSSLVFPVAVIAIIGMPLGIVFILCILAGFLCWKRGFAPARFYLLAWFTFCCGAIAGALTEFGLLPIVFLTVYGILIGSAMEVLLLSFGLADRINQEKKAKLLAQKEALDAQQQAIDNLHKADQLKDDFLANTSHELRTPLHGIIGLAESLIDGVAGPLNQTATSNLDMIAHSGKRLSNLVDDILDFSKMKHQELHLQLKSVGIKSLVEVVLTLSKPLLGSKPVLLINDIPDDLPLVEADENRLQQILINLVGNAIKFTHGGEIKLSAIQTSTTVEISVSDTGIGIPQEKQRRIFDSFEQADGSTAREYGGTGLGLSVTQQLVELHHSQIDLKSEEGKGSTFSFTLPVAKEQTREEQLVPPSPRVVRPLPTSSTWGEELEENTFPKYDIEKSKGKTILVVDDEPVNIQVLTNRLQINDYHILSAENGFQALEIIQREKPDLMILDLMMPRMSGYEVTNRVREHHDPSSLPIIMLTAKNQVDNLVEGFESGINDYLTKPFNKNELLSRVKSHLLLREYSQTLEHKVQERTEALEEKNEDLEQLLQRLKFTQDQLVEREKMAALGNLVAGVAHEINTPIGIGVTAASHLEEKTLQLHQLYQASEMKKSDLEGYLKHATQSSQLVLSNLNRAAELVQSFKQVAVDQSSEERRTIQLKAYLEKVLVSLQPKFKGTQHRIEVKGDEALTFDSYPGALAQILTNLVLNSLLHAFEPEGQGTISIEIFLEDQEILMKYRDDGKGIPEDHLGKIFDPFFTTKRGEGGSGLGLHLVYNIVQKQLNGTITCESHLGEGTLFTLRLPV